MVVIHTPTCLLRTDSPLPSLTSRYHQCLRLKPHCNLHWKLFFWVCQECCSSLNSVLTVVFDGRYTWVYSPLLLCTLM